MNGDVLFLGSTVVIVVALGSLGGFFADYAFATERLFCTAINYGKNPKYHKAQKSCDIIKSEGLNERRYRCHL